MANNDWRGALRIAARFPRLGAYREAITRAHGCFVDPRFYRQLGFDVDETISTGVKALKDQYGKVKKT
jgi:hypothetical protein